MSAIGRGAAGVLVAAMTAIHPGLVRAQPLEAVPFGGAIFPMGQLVEQGNANLSHRRSVVFGGRLDAWLWSSAGLELAVGFAPSGYHATSTAGTSADTTGGLFTATGRFLYRFARIGPVSWEVSAGAGVMVHGGSFLVNLASSGRQHLTGVVGLTGRVQVSEGTALIASAEDYLYSVKLGGMTGITPESRLNNAVVVSLGIVVPLFAHGEDDEYRVIR
jgi:hypothetical protein